MLCAVCCLYYGLKLQVERTDMKGDTINHSEIMAEYARELGVTTDTAKRLYDAYANIIIAKAAQG